MTTPRTLRAEVAHDLETRMKCGGISQTDLARRLGVSAAYVNRLVKGKENLTIETLAKVAAAIGHGVSITIDPL